MASQAPAPAMNPWEDRAIANSFPEGSHRTPVTPGLSSATMRRQDPLIFPGLYSASGLDVVSILLQVRNRPRPVIDLGAIDCSVSLTICDLEQPDMPIVYASDSFLELTGYSRQEVMGRNCRFLQTPGGVGSTASNTPVDRVATQRMAQAIHSEQEIQLQLVNYKKDGQQFTNVLSIIPLQLGPSRRRCAVGLQCEI